MLISCSARLFCSGVSEFVIGFTTRTVRSFLCVVIFVGFAVFVAAIEIEPMIKGMTAATITIRFAGAVIFVKTREKSMSPLEQFEHFFASFRAINAVEGLDSIHFLKSQNGVRGFGAIDAVGFATFEIQFV